MKECPEDVVRCSLYKAKSDPLPRTAVANQSAVYIKSPNGTESKTVCFYNVSLNNCSHAILRHVKDQPVGEYLDGDENTTLTCNHPRECKDYLRLYYGEGNQQTVAYCRDGLASLQESIPLSGGSFFAVYWVDNSGGRTGSFEVTAHCAENL